MFVENDPNKHIRDIGNDKNVDCDMTITFSYNC